MVMHAGSPPYSFTAQYRVKINGWLGGKIYTNLINWIETGSVRRTGMLCLIAGLLSALAFAPLHLVPFLCLSYPCLLLVLMKRPFGTQSFVYGWYFGFGQFYGGFYWIGHAFITQEDVAGWVGFVAVGFLAGGMAVYSGLVTLLVRYIHRKGAFNQISVILSFVILWNLAEWLRGHLFSGFPWNLSGYVWGFSDIMLQSTAFYGIYGLGVVTIFLSLTPLLPRIWQKAVGLCVPLAALFVFGLFRLPDDIAYHDDVRLRIIQPNISQRDKWDSAKKADNFLKYMAMSSAGEGEEKPTHVIWPETAVIYFLDQDEFRRFLISDMLGKDTTLLTGFPRLIREGGDLSVWNSFIAIGAQGNNEGLYDKFHLVPFGEYIPSFFRKFVGFFGLSNVFQGDIDYSTGPGLKTLHIPGTPPVGVLICYEVIFPGAVTDPADRPDWLLNVTNDAWYGVSSGPFQHFLQSRVRAIEEGLPMVRSAGTGISAIIDPYGRVVEQQSLNISGVVEGRLPEKIVARTSYSRWKDWTFMGLIIIVAASNVLFWRRKNKLDPVRSGH